MDDFRKEWGQFGGFLQEDYETPKERLYELIEKMQELALQWRARLQTIIAKDVQVDETLVGFWESVSQNSRDKQRIKLLEQRFWEMITNSPIDQFIVQLRNLLQNTQEEVQPVFYMSLSTLSKRAFEQEFFDHRRLSNSAG